MIHNQYLQNAKSRGLLQLSSVHHHVMDQMRSHLCDSFSLGDALELAKGDPVVRDSPLIAGNENRMYLVVYRAVEGLLASELLERTAGEGGSDRFSWSCNASEAH